MGKCDMSELPLRSLRTRLTYANVMSTVAVVAMLSTGTAYAAGRIGSADVIDNSLRTVDMRDGTLTGADIGLDKVGSADVAGLQGGDVADGSLRGDDIEDDSINSPDVFGINGGDITNDSVGPDDVTSLTGVDLIDGSLDGSELGDGSVGSDEVTNGSLGFDDLSASAKAQLLPAAYFDSGLAQVNTGETGERATVFSETAPAGMYVVVVAGQAYNAATASTSTTNAGFNCVVFVGDQTIGTVAGEELFRDESGDNQEEFAMTAVGQLSAQGEIALKCLAPAGTVTIDADLVATRVSSVN